MCEPFVDICRFTYMLVLWAVQFRHMTYHANESNYRDCDKHTIVRYAYARPFHLALRCLFSCVLDSVDATSSSDGSASL